LRNAFRPAAKKMYSTIKISKVSETIRVLENRIKERFPSSSLQQVCRDLIEFADEIDSHINKIRKRNPAIRIPAYLLIIMLLALLVIPFFGLKISTKSMQFFDYIQILEAAINDVVLLGIGIIFLFSIEKRIIRKKILIRLNKLRSIAHIIDMHHLTKDPTVLITTSLKKTRSSPERTMTYDEINRYLDYCSEMLSLVGKLAAVYAQYTTDDVVLSAVSELENVTTSLSNTVWQKIIILGDYKQK